MKQYVIERELPGAGDLRSDELREISQRSVEVLADMGGRVQWQHSYVTGDKMFCLYLAESPEAIREHGDYGGFPVSAIREVVTTISPVTAGR